MSINKKIIQDATRLIKSKYPSKDFLLKHPYIKESPKSEKEMGSDFINLHSNKMKSLYVEIENVHKLNGFIESLKNQKTKSQEKKDRKINRIKNQVLESLKKHTEELDLIKLNLSYIGKTTRESNYKFFIEKIILNFAKKIVNRCESFFEDSELKDFLIEVVKDIAWSEEFKNLSKDSMNINLKNCKFIDLDENLSLNKFEHKFMIDYIHLKNKEMFFYKKYEPKQVVLNEKRVYPRIKISYSDNFLETLSLDELSELNSLSNFDEISRLIISEEDVEVYLNKVFNKTIKNIQNLDEMLKKSFYPDFKNKLNKVNRTSARVSIYIKNKTFDVNEIRTQIIQSILNQIFDVKEKRLNGFKRSLNRRIIQKELDIKDFKDLFPKARSRNREILYIQGETNSGKTYTAFEMAKEYSSGIYAAPLRLLALEGQQEFEKRNVPCSMITGEEREEIEGANFVSSTVEMIDYSKEYDVAIIDEVQLINDPDRGHAWLEAIIGVNAKKVILVGSKDIEPVIKDIMNYLDESLEILKFERKTKLQFDKDLFRNSMDQFGKLPPHSAVIAFSKKDVLAMKARFEKCGNKVSVIYGALPPQVRRLETERFVNGETDVVIATDAIGMGLNLPIENIFFHKKEKFNGKEVTLIDSALVKQIVGRAGRYKKFDVGFVSALSNSVFNYIEKAFKKNTIVTKKDLKCSPNYPIINQIQELTGDTSIYKLLQNYNNSIKFDFDIKNHMNEYAYMVSRFLDDTSENRKDQIEQLTLFEKVKLVNAPISMDRSYKVLDYYKKSINDIYYLRDNPDVYPISVVYEQLDSLSSDTQTKTELSIKKLDLLSWLCFNFEEYSCLKDDIELKRSQLNSILLDYLRNIE